MSEEVRSFLAANSAGEGYPAMRFVTLKDYIKGRICDPPRVIETENRFHKGQMESALVLNLEVEAARGTVYLHTEDGKEEVKAQGQEHLTLWVKSGFMAQALADAVREAGDKDITEGAVVTVAWVDSRDTGKGNPAKIYKASYEPPARGVSVDEIAGDDSDEDFPF